METALQPMPERLVPEKKPRGKRRLFYLLALSVTALAVTLAAIAFLGHGFPMWEPAVPERTDDSVRIECLFMKYGFVNHGVPSDCAMVNLECSDPRGSSYGSDYQVQYLHNGQWYVVYRPEMVPSIGIGLGEGSNLDTFSFPAGLFERSGTYRLYIDSLGYCELPAGNN